MSERVPVSTLSKAAWPAALLVVSAFGWFSWRRVERIPLRSIRVEGAVVADPAAIRRLARVDPHTLLVDISPAMVSDRVRRHPWVREARALRLADGTLAIRVRERRPVLLVLSARGRPDHYLDADGQRMPYVSGHAFDVPVLRGLGEAFHPVRAVESAPVRELARVLPGLAPGVDALLDEFRVAPDGLVLLTTPAPPGQMLTVRLGRSGFAGRLERLKAFWDQAVLTRPEVRYASIDLRFDRQIVTRESS